MRVGSLFSGYGGLDLALRDVFGDVKTAWVSDIDPGACKILAHRFPDAPNLGDITAVDWARLAKQAPIEILTGGFPCQDVSTAGKRAGMKPGTRSGLWSHFAYAIDQLRPSLVLIENVRGLLSAEAHSDMEPCPWCMGDDSDSPLRALGAVLGDLADIGYDAAWCGLRAADVGAAHGRFRVFVAAYPQGDPWRFVNRDGGATSDTADLGHERGRASWTGRPRPADGHLRAGLMLPTPAARDWKGHGPADMDRKSPSLSAVSRLLPTPAVNDMGAGKTVEAWDEWTAKMQAAHGNGNGHGASLHVEALRLLPTPRTANNENRQSEGYGGKDGNFHGLITGQSEWGDYAAAIARQEQAFGRPAPDPTETAPKGGRRLSCRFDEWLMGLPDGWITDVPGITHNETLKACGNGVIWQQASAAIRWLLNVMEAAA